MKQTRRMIAFLLVMALVCTFTGTAFAAGIPAAKGSKSAVPASGFQSAEFIQSNTYQYADDEIVRAIVLLDSLPEIETALGNRAMAASLRGGLISEHQNILNLMKGLKFDLAYEFTSLLNGFSLDVAYGDLDFIASLPGVSSVHIANTYSVPDTRVAQPMAMVGGSNTGNTEAAASGYNGAGTVIAIIDTGLDLSHDAFQDADGLCEEHAALTEGQRPEGTADGRYISAKIPFAYDYADNDNNVDDQQGHGTHVSGIAAGYAVSEDGGVVFQGAAPAAQILAMKVFPDAQPGTTTDIYFRALEDAYRLNADVVNMSLGSIHGFTYDDSLETEVFGNIYQKLDEAGVIVNCAAGNSGSQADTSSKQYLGVDYNDHGTVGNPSTMDGNLSIASMENAAYPMFTVQIGEENFAYSDGTISVDDEVGQWLRTYAGETLPFAVVTAADGSVAVGTVEEFENADVEGVVAVVRRGDITFKEKAENAKAAGAMALVVVNNEPGMIRMNTDGVDLLSICVDQAAEKAFVEADPKEMLVCDEMVEANNPLGNTMSVFSSWGTTSSLTLDPCLSSYGGNILSAEAGADHDYIVMSGTSMATPMMSGTLANVLSFLDQADSATGMERAAAAEALLQSSAWIVPDGDSYYAVRRQGAGLGNAMNAIHNYRNAGYVVDPLKELGDDPAKSGEYSFDFTILNTSDKEVTYSDFDAIVLADVIGNINTEEDPVYANQMKSMPIYMDHDGNAAVTFRVDGEEISQLAVAPGASETVSVYITLDDEAKGYLNVSTYGAYVEGFVTFAANEEYENHATFLAYYGDWTEAPIMESADFQDLLEVMNFMHTNGPEGQDQTFEELGYSPLDFLDVYTMPNMAYTYDTRADSPLYYAGGALFSKDTPFRPEYNAFSTAESDSAFTDSFAMVPFQLRNASSIAVRISDAESGEVLADFEMPYNKRAIFDYEGGQWASASFWVWDGTDNENMMIPSDTRLNITMDSVLPYGHDGSDTTLQENTWSFDVTIDYNVPELNLSDIVVNPEAGVMTVESTDSQYLQAILLMEPSRSVSLEDDVYGGYVYANEEAGQTETAEFDIQELLDQGITEVNVVSLDYATNYSVQRVDLTKATEPQPEPEPGKPCYFEKFVDCTEEWYHEAVDYMVDRGLMVGVSEDRFAPSSGLTRAMAVQVLYAVADRPEPENPSGFSDVPEDEWYADAVAWARENNIVAGVTEDRFAPEENITREQIATILWSSEGKPEVEQDLSAFVDANEIEDYAVPAMKWAVANGLFSGDNHSRLNPLDTATRAEFAVIMLRYLDGSYECENLK